MDIELGNLPIERNTKWITTYIEPKWTTNEVIDILKLKIFSIGSIPKECNSSSLLPGISKVRVEPFMLVVLV